MAAMHPFAGLDGDHPRPRLAGSVARSARPVPAPALLRRLEPLAAVFCGLHGVIVLSGLGGPGWRWAAVGLVLALGLAGLGGRGPAWIVPLRAGAILVVGVELELGRRERLGKALLDALADPTSVLDAQGRIVAANQAWVRFAATDLAGLEPAANGVRAVLAGEASLFRCRYQAPDGTRPYEVTVTPLAEGDGAVVTPLAEGDGAVVSHRPPPPAVS
jgi:PAS domain-containing protein